MTFEEKALRALNDKALLLAAASPRAEKPEWKAPLAAELKRRGLKV